MSKKKTPSAFVRAALELDETFDVLEQVAHALNRLELEGEASLEKARQLVTQFTDRNQGLGDVLVALGTTLDQRRAAVQSAAESVNERAPMVRHKLEQYEARQESFRVLSQRAEQAEQLSPDQLATLTQEVAHLVEQARAERLRSLERGGQALLKSLKGRKSPRPRSQGRPS